MKGTGMGSKEQISNTYTDHQKAIYMPTPVLANPPEERRAVVFGWRPSNIGDVIADRLRDDKFTVFALQEIDCDVTNPKDVAECLDRLGDVDTAIFVNGYTHLDWIENYHPHELRRVIESTLLGSMIGSQQFVSHTLEQPYRKHIVFIGSMAYKTVLNASSAYCAAKAGLSHFARCIAWELAPKNYDVFTVNPSNVEGMPMTAAVIEGIQRYRNVDYETAANYWGAVLPKHRWLQAEDIANTVAWLVSGEATYLSGSQVDLAGGQR